MLRIKRLYIYVLQTFLPLFIATFGVCLFIILMQFLWKYVDEMVGKGISMSVLAEMFFYAALTFVPLALPLAILLASLMAFGNMGEKLELLAMKSAGVSLIKVMRPLIVFLIFIAAAGFYFQNIVLPISQVKMWTLVLSMKQKSPELDIPEGSFYNEIPGYSVYVEGKNRETGILYDMMIYDYSQGFENATVIVADSGRLKASNDKMYLILTIYNGDSFQNFNRQKNQSSNSKVPYRRETFRSKEILISFDANFSMADESIMGSRDISKNIAELRTSVDSMNVRRDSTNQFTTKTFRNYLYSNPLKVNEDSIQKIEQSGKDSILAEGFDAFFKSKTLQQQEDRVSQALTKVESIKNDYQFKAKVQSAEMSILRGHEIEFHKKFTLSVACLVFLFIGAPLGAIIRKGGLGMPTVISVFLFLFYYVIDMMGAKLAKQGVLMVWQGMWISSFILFGLGFFLTYKAVNDSVMLNADAWTGFFKRFFGKRESRNYQKKELIMTYPDYADDQNTISILNNDSISYLGKNKKLKGYISFWKRGFNNPDLIHITDRLEKLVEDLRNSDQNLIIGKLMDYPVITIPKTGILNKPVVRMIAGVFFPVGLILYIYGFFAKKRIIQDLKTILKVNQELEEEIRKLPSGSEISK